ncbi:MAG: carbohydrate kinase family protein [Gaiellales bacterium]
MSPDLVLLGNLIVDDLVFADGRTRMGEAGGAMLYAALGARLWNVSVGIVAPLGSDYPDRALDLLETRGVELDGLRALPGAGLRAQLLYDATGRRVVHQPGASHEEASPRPGDLPESFHGARAFHLAPMPLARQRVLAEALGAADFLSLDPFEPLSEENRDTWPPILHRLDMLFLSDEELRVESARHDAVSAIRDLARSRLRFVALKQGPGGGILYDGRENRVLHWPGATAVAVDPTGAGDAFAGGFLAGWLAIGDSDLAVEQGAVSASFAIEGWGASALGQATPAQARERQQEWFGTRTGA